MTKQDRISQLQQDIPRAWREDIENAVKVMRQGGVIIYPTDTIWGIGCDATSEEAVRRIFEIKRRTDAKAMLSLVDSDGRLQRYVRDVPEVAWQIVDCSESPVTIIYDGVQGLAPSLLSDDGSAGLRITKEPFSNELCRRMQRAVVSTSANVSGAKAPSCFDEINPEILMSVDYVCTSRRNEKNPHASSIIKIAADGQFKIIRK